eukprot:9477792-Pyramimonas_sp.AAC.1
MRRSLPFILANKKETSSPMGPSAEDQHVPGFEVSDETGVERGAAGELLVNIAARSAALQTVAEGRIQHALSCALQKVSATPPDKVRDARDAGPLLGQRDPAALARRERSRRS